MVAEQIPDEPWLRGRSNLNLGTRASAFALASVMVGRIALVFGESKSRQSLDLWVCNARSPTPPLKRTPPSGSGVRVW